VSFALVWHKVFYHTACTRNPWGR